MKHPPLNPLSIKEKPEEASSNGLYCIIVAAVKAAVVQLKFRSDQLQSVYIGAV